MSEYKEMNTEPLINEMVSLCLEVPPELAQEIASREDAISYLRDILQNEKFWNHGGPGDAWAPYHVIHILPLIKTKEALELLFETMRDETDLLGDWITESTPTFAAFLIDELLSFKDPNLLPQVRKAFEDGKIDTEVISRYDMDWVFNLPEEEQSYSKFMKSPLEHFSRENISYLKKISYIESKTPKKSNMKKIGRNDPCPCGSGKKYKKCCMKM